MCLLLVGTKPGVPTRRQAGGSFALRAKKKKVASRCSSSPVSNKSPETARCKQEAATQGARLAPGPSETFFTTFAQVPSSLGSSERAEPGKKHKGAAGHRGEPRVQPCQKPRPRSCRSSAPERGRESIQPATWPTDFGFFCWFVLFFSYGWHCSGSGCALEGS